MLLHKETFSQLAFAGRQHTHTDLHHYKRYTAVTPLVARKIDIMQQ